MSALLAGNVAAARETYQKAATAADYDGRSLAAIGLADIAILEGRFRDAIADLPAAIKADAEAKNEFGAVAKLVALAEAHKAAGDTRAAQAAIADARGRSDEDKVLVAEAMIAVSANRLDVARRTAQELGKRLPAHSRAYGRLVEAEIARAGGDYPSALDALEAGRKLADLWLLRYYSGLIYLQSGRVNQALDEFERCQKRIGEATAAFLDDLPTYRYTAELPGLITRANHARSQSDGAASVR
jgi:tetratricopeptide (TPR) repeat protein